MRIQTDLFRVLLAMRNRGVGSPNYDIRILSPGSLGFLLYLWKTNAENATFARLAVNAHLALVCLRQLEDDLRSPARSAPALPHAPGGSGKYLVGDLPGHAGACVLDFDD